MTDDLEELGEKKGIPIVENWNFEQQLITINHPLHSSVCLEPIMAAQTKFL